MPDQAYRHAQLPGRHVKARRLVVDRALRGASSNNPRVIVTCAGRDRARDHNGAWDRARFANVRS
jgi:hypothetical protein